MSKYVLVFLIKGKPGIYLHNLTSKLSKQFRVKNVFKRIPPHVTLKYIGEIKSETKIKELIFLLKNFIKGQGKIKIHLRGIGYFDKRVIFVKVLKTKQLIEFYNELCEELKKLKWMPCRKYERKQIKFHLTLAKGNIKAKFQKILEYLSNKNLDYSVFIDKMILMKYENQKWRIYKSFDLR